MNRDSNPRDSYGNDSQGSRPITSSPVMASSGGRGGGVTSFSSAAAQRGTEARMTERRGRPQGMPVAASPGPLGGGSSLPLQDLSTQNVVSPSVNEAVNALFNNEEKQKLRTNLIEEQIKQAKYLREHPEINHLLQIAIGKLVKDQPEDPVVYLTSFFADQDLEELEASHREHEEYLQAVVQEKHAQLADPTVFSLQ